MTYTEEKLPIKIPTLSKNILSATIIVTAFGFLIDMYDFLIFNIVRTSSLTDLHLSGDALTESGLLLSNCQLSGLLIGSYLWGVLGDRFGRKSCLFASILTYSLASLYCGMVQSIETYALARFLAGLGVAGEVGIGITLISEKLTAERRGYGITFFIALGYVGVVIAEQVGTNVRATVTTTIPNFARALVIPMNLLFTQLKPINGPMTAIGIIGFLIFTMALWEWKSVDETYGKPLNYAEY